MKKTKLITILLMLTLLFCAFALTACGDNDNDDGKSDPVKLTAPTVTLDGDTATWTAVENADKYEIDINGSLSYLASSQTSKKLADGDVFKVRAIGDGKAYMTSDWSKMVTYTVEDNSNPDIPVYTVTWKSGSTVLEVDYNVPMGTIPTYNGATPTKAADAQYSYNFSGWSPAVTEVMADVTYSAVFTEVTNSYKVVWKNGDAILETDTNVPYGTMPAYNGATPTKASNEQYSYTFSGWSPEVSVVTGDVTYQAQFTSSTRIYTVTFYSDDGVTVLARVSVSYGVAAAYSKPTPIKNATEYYVYTFDKWVTSLGGTQEASLSSIKSDINVYASFTATVRTLNLSVITNNSNYGEVSTTEIKNIAYGSLVEINGNVLTVDGKSVTATPKISTPQYTYTFVRWDAPVTVVSNTIIKATFERTVNKYTVTWKNGDEILEIDEDVIYGSTPVYNGAIPTKSADSEFTYTFAGWSPAVAAVTGDVTYYATFTDATNKYTVTFYDDNATTVLGVAVVEYGQSAVYPNALPTKQSTPEVTYTFDKWMTAPGGAQEADLSTIISDISVYASYISTTRIYTVTVCDFDGEVIVELQVPYGATAELPEDMNRDGYRFTGWSDGYQNVCGDVVITAQYVKQILVNFIDYDGTAIYHEYLDLDENGKATFTNIPEKPTRIDYECDGWTVTDFTNLVEDIIVYPVYTRTYRVAFVDYDGTVLKNENVRSDIGIATAPIDPIRDGYKFVDWDCDLENITSDITINAIYEINTYSVKFVLKSDSESTPGAILSEYNVPYTYSAPTPTLPEIYFDWSNKNAYRFVEILGNYSNITSDTIVYVYYERVNSPILYIENISVIQGTRNASVEVYLFGGENVRGLSLDIKFDERLQNAGNAVVDVSSALGEAQSKLTRNGSYELRWISSNSNSLTADRIVTFTFALNSSQEIDQYAIEVLDSTYVITKDFLKLTPLIISGSVTVSK